MSAGRKGAAPRIHRSRKIKSRISLLDTAHQSICNLEESDGTAQKDAGNGGGARFFKPAFHGGKCSARGQDIVYQ